MNSDACKAVGGSGGVMKKRRKPFPARLILTTELRARCRALRATGMYYRDIAAACGCSLSTAWKACRGGSK